MFYNNRNIVYTILIMIALIFAFFCGRQMGNNKVVNTAETTKVVAENVNYNSMLSVKGTDYSLDYTITKAFFLDKSTMSFNVDVQKNEKVQTIKVVVKDQDNNVLEVKPNVSSDAKILSYTTVLNNNTTKINIEIYPLTKEMSENSNLNLNTISVQSSKLDVGLIKKSQIDNLQ